MSVFDSLRSLVNWVLGADLSERPAPPREPAPRQQQVLRAPSTSGDGFDAAPRTPRVVLDASVEAPPRVPEASEPEGAVPSMDFKVSFEDLKDLVDEPLEPQPEFIPEGGMSTESLMREFESLVPADDALEHVEASAPKSLPTPLMAEGERPAEPQAEPPSPSSPPLVEHVEAATPHAESVPVAPSEIEALPAPAPTDFNASLDDLAAASQFNDPGDKKD